MTISGKGEIRRALITAVLFTILASGCFACSSTAMNHAPIITEVYYDTYLKGDTDGEFIRIHNPTEGSINIGDWHITDHEGVITFPEWANIRGCLKSTKLL